MKAEMDRAVKGTAQMRFFTRKVRSSCFCY